MGEGSFLGALGVGPEIKNFVFLGEAGCGKSEVAINLSRRLVEEGEKVHLFDLDMTKPLFRSRDQREALEGMGIDLRFEEQFMDAPTLTGGVARLLRDEGSRTVLDVGGDYIGARSIGGYASLLNRGDTAVYYIINPFRPWSGDLEHIDKVLGETLGVSHVSIEGLRLVCNPNLGRSTRAEDVVQGCEQVCEQVGAYKPVEFCCVWEPLEAEVKGRLSLPLFPLKLYLNYPWTISEGPGAK